jgi:hypothetical protein
MIDFRHGRLGLHMNGHQRELGGGGQDTVGAEAGDERLPNEIIPRIIVH